MEKSIANSFKDGLIITATTTGFFFIPIVANVMLQKEYTLWKSLNILVENVEEY